jgi:hypothetical protein
LCPSYFNTLFTFLACFSNSLFPHSIHLSTQPEE